jgi:hypothetical protein
MGEKIKEKLHLIPLNSITFVDFTYQKNRFERRMKQICSLLPLFSFLLPAPIPFPFWFFLLFVGVI